MAMATTVTLHSQKCMCIERDPKCLNKQNSKEKITKRYKSNGVRKYVYTIIPRNIVYDSTLICVYAFFSKKKKNKTTIMDLKHSH